MLSRGIAIMSTAMAPASACMKIPQASISHGFWHPEEWQAHAHEIN
ncbi:MAG: hypothetical protein ACLSUW_04885 [Akkermansia sp.]